MLRKKESWDLKRPENTFKRKTLDELMQLTPDRIKRYYRSIRNQYEVAYPWWSECSPDWKYEGQEEAFDSWAKYISFVNAIKHQVNDSSKRKDVLV